MTPEQIVASTNKDMRALGYTTEEAALLRKRARAAIWQRQYRASGRDTTTKRNFWIGYLDGPPIEHDILEERMKADAVKGSQMLEARIRQVFGA